MTRGDDTVERAAERLEHASREAAGRGGLLGKAAAELAEDAVFLRKLKPSLIAARARGLRTPSSPSPRPAAPAGPQLPPRDDSGGNDPSPFLVVGGALAAGILLAKLIDWRSHAHPKR